MIRPAGIQNRLLVIAFLLAGMSTAVPEVMANEALHTEPTSATHPLSQAQAESLKRAIADYDAGHFNRTVDELEALRKQAVKHPKVEYYLGNSYVRIGNSSQATEAYKRCLDLEPRGPLSEYCHQGLKQMSQHEAHTHAAPAGSAAGDPPSETKSTSTNLTVQLPPIPKVTAEDPSDETIQSWSNAEKGRFLFQAKERLERAKERSTQAETLVSKVKNITRSLVPSQADFGESSDDFLKRKNEAIKHCSELLQPYETQLENARRAQLSAQGVYDSCVVSERGLNGGWTPIGR